MSGTIKRRVVFEKTTGVKKAWLVGDDKALRSVDGVCPEGGETTSYTSNPASRSFE